MQNRAQGVSRNAGGTHVARRFSVLAVWALGACLQGAAASGEAPPAGPAALESARGAGPSPAPKAPSHGAGHFIDAVREAGIAVMVTRGRPTPQQRLLLEVKGGGAAWIDYDGDGWLDIYLVNGNDPSRTGPQPRSYLFRNNRDGTFTDVTDAAGVGSGRYGFGVAVGDYDNDGWDDLYVTNYRGNLLYRNNGDGTFADVTARAGVGNDARWSASAAFGDVNNDGLLDLYVTNYLTFDIAAPPGEGGLCLFNDIIAPCGPIGLSPEPDTFYLNNGDGTFKDISAASGIRSVPNAYGLGVIMRDLDNDGWTDIYVANDMFPNYLFRNKGDGTFEEIGLLCGAALSDTGCEEAGMGVDAADIDGDSWQEIIVGNYENETCAYYRNDAKDVGRCFFTHASFQAGIGDATYPFLTFGAKFFDADNDGNLDIFLANGHVHPNVEGVRRPGFNQRNFLFMHAGVHRFRDESATRGPGLGVVKASRAAAFADYDNNGTMDILVINVNDTPTLLRNGAPGPDAHWIEIQTVGRRSNRNGIGAVITLEAGGRKWRREVRRDGSYCASNDPRTHFGLGAISTIDRVTIEWPSGQLDVHEKPPADRIVRFEEGGP